MANQQLRVLTLNEGEKLESTLFRLEKGWILHFVLGPSLHGLNVKVYTNHPASAKDAPDRTKYRRLKWQNYSKQKSDVYDNFAECHIVQGGSFNYYFTAEGDTKKNGSGYFLVDPHLVVGKYDEKLPLDCICCHTVLTKSLGHFQSWKSKLEVSKNSGYNMVHFTPLQELGISRSAYCIKDQMMFNSELSQGKATMQHVGDLVDFMKNEWGVLSLTDLVFNHTANESPWIKKAPNCAYNVCNTPHLRPPYMLDRILWRFSEDVSKGKYTANGLPPQVSTEEHLNIIRELLSQQIIPKYKLHEFYIADIEETVEKFKVAALGSVAPKEEDSPLELITDPRYRRMSATVDIALAIHQFKTENVHNHEGVQCQELVCERVQLFREKLQDLNGAKYEEIRGHLDQAVNNYISNARYRFVQEDGERLDQVSLKQPLMYNYFTLPEENMTLEQEEMMIYTERGQFCMAHNGWVMGHDPLVNFAEPGSNVYLRRELIPWGDSVKLKYGSDPDCNPILWEHMRQYTVETAKRFHGVRLDNCHSTPIHVAEYMLDEARKVRPNLYVIAELFTSDERTDNIFINRLGLTSLIREALNAHDSHDQGRLVHRFGGYPVGAFIQPPARQLTPRMAHAIFMDQTHDNPSPVEKRSALDMMPSAALVAMASCATGSNRGYDELVPHHIHVVNEERMYPSWGDSALCVNMKTGIIAAKKALNDLHKELGMTGFHQIYVDQVDKDIVAVTRHNPVSHQSVILVARTVFSEPANMDTTYVPPLVVPGLIDEIILEGRMFVKSTQFKKDDKIINGLPDYQLSLRQHIKIFESETVELRDHGDRNVQEVDFVSFPPGSVIALKISLNSSTRAHILSIRQNLTQFGFRMSTYSGRNLKEISSSDLENIAAKMSLLDISRCLYHCDPEERDDGLGFAAYNVPNYGTLVYCGLQGIVSVLDKIRNANDLGHPLCDNLRSGDWMCDFTANRLLPFDGTKELGEWFQMIFDHLRQIPRYLIPCYFDAVVTGVNHTLLEVAHAKMSNFVRDGSSFVRSLAMGSLQFLSYVRSAPLPLLSPYLVPPIPPTMINEETGTKEQFCITPAAGLPFFSSGLFRNWGRDTFISARGLLLLVGRFEATRYIILAYAGALRHGLIPNLLGAGVVARYNCRDAVWWWLQTIQDYCTMVPEGWKILNDKVSRLYPNDDSQPEAPGLVDQELSEVIQEAMQRHADGVDYRERNAGPGMDEHMSDEGFNNNIGINWETGFVYGGNKMNCGTWMDKMGSSHQANNWGKPATPRNGSAVELVGLQKSAIRWLAEMYKKSRYPHEGVMRMKKGVGDEKDKVRKITYADWNNLIQKNFEHHFWIPENIDDDHDPRPELVHQRGIYKDSLGADPAWADYQLRPNFPVAMVVAPELFDPNNAWLALKTAEQLIGPLGMKTLDPSDWQYNGDYEVSIDNNDFRSARGHNYHNGPEWVWPIGYYLRAKLHFARLREETHPQDYEESMRLIKTSLAHHNVHIRESDWRSLPELTNTNGSYCRASCQAQAWSVACILDVLFDLEKLTLTDNEMKTN